MSSLQLYTCHKAQHPTRWIHATIQIDRVYEENVDG